MTEIPFSQAGAPSAVPPQPARDVLTPGMLDALAKTKPWVRFVAVLCYIGVVLMIAGGAVMAAIGLFQMSRSGAEGALLVGMSLLYVVMGILYFFPSRYLWRYGTSIEDALHAPFKTHAVEQALTYQKSFWKFMGIMSLVMILLYIPGVLAAIAIPNFLTAMQRSKQKRTMADMRMIATALETRAGETDDFPRASTMEDIARELEPRYLDKLPRTDGWETRYVYAATDCESGKCLSYVLASAAGDKKFERENPTEWNGTTKEPTSNFNDDIVLANGVFVRAPALK